MPRYRVTLAYDGTDYQGWQVQPNGDTIQGRLERALTTMAGTPIRVVGAGRTDTGVHARAQVAHFDLEKPIPADGLRAGLNSLLPADIRVLRSEAASPEFHARYSARSKIYRYYIDRSPVASPFRARFTLHHPHSLDRQAMDQAASQFLGRHDFAAFAASSTSVKATIRDCTASRFVPEGDAGEIVYEISADGFLHHMVRNVLGTILEIGRGKLSPDDVESLFASRDRRRSGPTAPAHGLHLVRVDYDEN